MAGGASCSTPWGRRRGCCRPAGVDMIFHSLVRRTFITALLTLSACGPQDAEQGALQSSPLITQTVPVQPIEDLGVLDAFNAIILGGVINKTVPMVILELKDGDDSRGKFTLGSQYSSLTALATHLNSQDTNYTWSVTTQGVLVGRPTTGSLLNKTLGSAMSFSNSDLCTALKTIVHTALPTTPGLSGCRSRGVPQYLSKADLSAVGQATFSGSGSATQKVVDIIAPLLDGLPASISLLIYSPGSGLRPVVSPVW